jgi:16S rRNA (cytosine1402-N4)-methyltransferase
MQGSTTPWQHTTVLLHEAVEALWDASAGPVPPGVYVDATFGRGGHSRLLLSHLPPDATLLALDRDPDAIAHATQGPDAITDPRFRIEHAAFSSVGQVVADLGLGPVRGLLMDIGVSSPQIDNPERGFSFRFDAPLDMRMDTTQGESVADYLAHATVDELTHVIHTYGEERFARQIAKALVARREAGEPVRTTSELSNVVAGAVKTREAGQNPATRTFQALRIHVNGELDELQTALEAALMMLAPGGRLAVISFHSLEDRIVKTFIAKHSRDEVDRRAPFAPPQPLLLHSLGRVKPSDTEVLANPRSRSAVLRVAERTDVPWSAKLARSEAPSGGKAARPKRAGGGRR